MSFTGTVRELVPTDVVNGKVPLWDLTRKRWVRRMAVDAREALRGGGFSLTGPEDAAPEPVALDQMSRAELARQVEALDVAVDARWDADRLRKIVQASRSAAASSLLT